jgi:hypothetical protein
VGKLHSCDKKPHSQVTEQSGGLCDWLLDSIVPFRANRAI